MTVDPAAFWGALKRRGYTFFAGVPDSTFGQAYALLLRDPEVRYVPAVREDVALGVASAAYFLGARGCVVMQNSGVGNVVNALTSYNLVYRVPVRLVVGWRGYGGPGSDAPEHWVMGAKTPSVFELLDLPWEVLEPARLEETLDTLTARIEEASVPGALLVRPGVFA